MTKNIKQSIGDTIAQLTTIFCMLVLCGIANIGIVVTMVYLKNDVIVSLIVAGVGVASMMLYFNSGYHHIFMRLKK